MAHHSRVAVFIGMAMAVTLLGPAQASERQADRPGSFTLGGIECGLIPTRAPAEAPPVGVLVPCPGVRPGAVVQSDFGQCTFNFLWVDT